MANLFPIDLGMHARPIGHGYTRVHVDAPNPFLAVGTTIRGHEFHYSGPVAGVEGIRSCLDVECGVGVGNGRDGLIEANTLACYTHVHADGVEAWAGAVVSRAAEYAAKRRVRRPGREADGDRSGQATIDAASTG